MLPGKTARWPWHFRDGWKPSPRRTLLAFFENAQAERLADAVTVD